MADAGTALVMRDDEAWMAQALDLALEGIGRASPNPSVGCVLVQEGRRVGCGYHEYDRRDHAEIVALREAGAQARGATAYVTLEPCSHHGRTGPCADALIAAGVARVVVATADPNPAVHGRGIARLRDAGVVVEVGPLQEPSRRTNDSFAKWIKIGNPYITLKAAMSLDGCIAPARGEQQPGKISWITGHEARQQVQWMRHSVDAVMTGIGTVLADDPLLTDRSGLRRRRPLLRVVLDSQLRLPLDSKLVRSSADDLLILRSDGLESVETSKKIEALSAAGATVVSIPVKLRESGLPLASVVQHLAALQITSVLVEAGSRLSAAFLNAGLVDRLFLFYAPQLLGPGAQPLLGSSLLRQPEIGDYELHRYGIDFALEARLTDPWAP